MEDEKHAFCKELLPETRQIGTRQRRFWDESMQIIMYQDLLFGSNPPNKMCVSWVVSSSSFYDSSCINDTSTSVSSTLGSDWWFEAIPSTYFVMVWSRPFLWFKTKGIWNHPPGMVKSIHQSDKYSIKDRNSHKEKREIVVPLYWLANRKSQNGWW